MAKEDKSTNVGKDSVPATGKPAGKTAGADKRITPGYTIKLGRESGGNPIVIVNDQTNSSNGDSGDSSGDSSGGGSGEGDKSDNK